MVRCPRLVFPLIPHHVTQRGNYRQEVFLTDGDYRQYLRWLASYSKKYGLEIWAYCLMSNHVHLIVVPRHPESLARALSTTHMRYSQFFNQKLERSGHLWQGRFFSSPMDEDYLLRAVRYVELNPVRAGMVSRAADWPWSSARAHLLGTKDELLVGSAWPPTDLLADWGAILEEPEEDNFIASFRKQTYSNRPMGSESFVDKLEEWAGRPLRPSPRGRPRRIK